MKQLATFSLLLSLFFSACSDGSLLQNTRCEKDSDCQEDLVCKTQHCVVDAPNHIRLSAQITPPPGSQIPSQQILDLDLRQGAQLEISLAAPKPLRGVVRAEDAAPNENLQGDIEFQSEGDIPGMDYRFKTSSFSQLDSQGDGYRINLLPNRAYNGIFRPKRADIPPHRFYLSQEELEKGRFNVFLPASDSYKLLRGRLRKADYSPVPYAKVTAITASKDSLGSTLTEEPRGQFRLPLPASVSEIWFRVESTDDSELFPEFTAGPFPVKAEDGDLVDLEIKTIPTGSEAILGKLQIFQPSDKSDKPKAASNLTVNLVGIFEGGILRRNGSSDTQGFFYFQAIPGAYECLISTPSRGQLANWHGYIEVNENHGAEVTLQTRPILSGYILDAFGKPMRSGTLTFERRIQWREDMSLTIAPSPTEVRWDESGHYEVSLDPGTYDVNIKPDPESDAPVDFFYRLVMGERNQQQHFQVGKPSLLELIILTPTGQRLPNTQVELWTLPPSGAPRLFASAVTNERGQANFVIPHEDKPSEIPTD